jgi:hypothetical protein
MSSTEIDLEPLSTKLPSRVNVPHEELYANIRRNIRRNLPQLDVYPPNDYDVALLCGGPSLKRARIPKHCKIATVNNTHEWVQAQRKREPSVHIMLDAREFNKRFVATPVKSCRYFIASQCHPGVFDALDGYDTRIFHIEHPEDAPFLNKFYMNRWRCVPGGTTVGTRAIWLLYMIGVRKIRVFGMDGCLEKGEHHAYAQEENDNTRVLRMRVGRRVFRTYVWMAYQIEEFLQMVRHLPDDLDIRWEGDGAMAYIIEETVRNKKVPRLSLLE